MTDVNPAAVQESLAFQLGVIGTIATDTFAQRIEAHDLKPKHVGMMLVLDLGVTASQLDLARRMAVAPSLVVALADHLEELGAIQRVRDPADRRRQVLTLTDHGRALLATCGTIAHALDAEFTAKLSATERAVLRKLFHRIVSARGLDPTSAPAQPA